MSTSAIIMMLIGCVGLWGGCGVSIAIALKHNRRKKAEPVANTSTNANAK